VRLDFVAVLMNATLIVLHGLASVSLIILVLLHAGRGGGLSDMFGGVSGSSMAGSTVVEKNLDRITVVIALVFLFTTVSLSMRLT
jgi:preprotein translocase subunit SecG